jgi:hypothetical protein
MLQSGPHQIEFGHVCEDPHEWEQRYEKKDLAKQRHQGQVATATPTGFWLFYNRYFYVSFHSLAVNNVLF